MTPAAGGGTNSRRNRLSHSEGIPCRQSARRVRRARRRGSRSRRSPCPRWRRSRRSTSTPRATTTPTRQLYAGFTEATGIQVNRIEGQPDELIARMKAEGANSPADILLTVDAGRIWLADQEGLLQPVASRRARGAHPRAPAPPRRPLVRLLAARADDLLRQGPGREPAADLRGARRPGLERQGLHPLVLERLQPVADGRDHRPRRRGRREGLGRRACSTTSRAPAGGRRHRPARRASSPAPATWRSPTATTSPARIGRAGRGPERGKSTRSAGCCRTRTPPAPT